MDAALVFLGIMFMLFITFIAVVKAWFVNKEYEAEQQEEKRKAAQQEEKRKAAQIKNVVPIL